MFQRGRNQIHFEVINLHFLITIFIALFFLLLIPNSTMHYYKLPESEISNIRPNDMYWKGECTSLVNVKRLYATCSEFNSLDFIYYLYAIILEKSMLIKICILFKNSTGVSREGKNAKSLQPIIFGLISWAIAELWIWRKKWYHLFPKIPIDVKKIFLQWILP